MVAVGRAVSRPPARECRPDAQGIYRSQAVSGFWLQTAWLWQFPLPDAEDVLLDIIGKPYADYRRERMRQRGW